MDSAVKVIGIVLLLMVVVAVIYGVYTSPSVTISIQSCVSKQVVDKQAPIENRFSAPDIVFGSGSITKSQTVYYLIAQDGTVVEVGLSDYAKVKIGDTYKSDNWISK